MNKLKITVHRQITKNFIAIMMGPEKVPDWQTTRITYLLSKSEDSKDVRTYRPITCLQDPNRNNSQKNFHTFGRAELTTSREKRMSPWK